MAQKTSLAVDLARQAAAAAKAELQPEPTAAAGSFSRWQPPALPEKFELGRALGQALHQAAGHFARTLRHEGLDVAPAPQGVEATEQIAVHVKEGGGSHRVVRGYSAPALLGLFASQQQRTGVVVDGQV